MQKSDKEIIVAAAIKRFSHYGFGKTTMAELASDCDMSVGNLYRFYKNKEEIAVEGARSCMTDKALVGEMAAADTPTAMQALRSFCLARLRFLHHFVSEMPHMYELVQLIAVRHKDVLRHFEDRAGETITKIIVAGIDTGEFRDCNAALMAADIYNATTKYNMPLCMDAPLPRLESELGSLLDLIDAGLKVEQTS